MNWKLILKDPKNQPATGHYPDWKELIAKECYNQCVYCSIHESQFGGIDTYHIDHYRPTSLPKFSHLEDILQNLFYSCPVCNRFKSNDWPSDPANLDTLCYPDPSVIDYSLLFMVDLDNLKLVGLYKASKYLIERLYLNRAQLIFERREARLRKKCFGLSNKLYAQIDDLAAKDLNFAFEMQKEIDSVKNNLIGLEDYRRTISPYSLKDIRKRK